VDVVVLLAAGIGTALATGLGAIPVWFLGGRSEKLRPALWGFAAGTMGVVSIVGLLASALDEGSVADVGLGLALGVGFMLATKRYLAAHRITVHGRQGEGVRSSVLVFAVLFVHSFPEGLAMGTAFASSTAGLGLYVIVAIALQNVPEGTSVAIPMNAAGFSKAQQFWAAVVTSVPQPVAAIVAYALVEQVDALLPVSFAFAAGAMFTLVALELLPQALARSGRNAGLAGATAGGALMLALGVVLGV
jgi:zinc transporter, ZIP family